MAPRCGVIPNYAATIRSQPKQRLYDLETNSTSGPFFAQPTELIGRHPRRRFDGRIPIAQRPPAATLKDRGPATGTFRAPRSPLLGHLKSGDSSGAL